jgi:hypothetical protein
LVLLRIGGITGLSKTIPEWTSLHPLLWGSIFGILCRDALIWILSKISSPPDLSEKDPIRRKMAQNPRPSNKESFWLEPELWFVFFLTVCLVERMLAYHPWSFAEGISFKEGFYFKNFSYRQAFGLSFMVWDNLIPAIWYFLVEERTSRDSDNPIQNWTIGLSLVFLIQSIVMSVQSFLDPLFFMQATGDSLVSGRIAGLFKDSGSASWIYPTLGLFLFWNVWEKKGIWRNNSRYLGMLLIGIGTLAFGFKLGRAFWAILMFAFWLGSMYLLINRFLFRQFWIRALAGLGIFLFSTFFLFSFLWFGKNQSLIPSLKRISENLHSWNLDKGIAGLEDLDPNRVRLAKASLDLFSTQPFFGAGMGSMITELKNPKSMIKTKPEKGFVDSPSNFFLGWLGEFGILGSLLLTLYLSLQAYLRKNLRYFWLLLVPLMTGMQIVHSDGAFFFVFLLLGTKRMDTARSRMLPQRKNLVLGWGIISMGISIHYILYSIFR